MLLKIYTHMFLTLKLQLYFKNLYVCVYMHGYNLLRALLLNKAEYYYNLILFFFCWLIFDRCELDVLYVLIKIIKKSWLNFLINNNKQITFMIIEEKKNELLLLTIKKYTQCPYRLVVLFILNLELLFMVYWPLYL